MSPKRPSGTEKCRSCASVRKGVPLAACGQLALAIVQVFPAAASVQAVIAVAPAESEEITAPLIGEAPAASEATVITAVSNAARCTLESLAVYVPEWSAARRKICACCDPPPAAKSRDPADRSVPSAVPPGTTKGCTCSGGWNLKVARATPRFVFVRLIPGDST